MASSAAAQRKQNLLLGGCVCYAVLLSYAFRQFEMAQQITCDDEMPLVQRSESLLSEDVLAELLRAATTHTASNEGTSLNEGFAGSRGFVLRFNREGAQELVANVSCSQGYNTPDSDHEMCVQILAYTGTDLSAANVQCNCGTDE